MKNKKYEIRSFGGDAAPILNERTIEGYAIVFNKRSEVMLDWSAEHGWRKFVEVIDPSSLRTADLLKYDIRALVEHNRERLLARSNKGKGSLELTVDEHGLHYRFEAANTADGDYAVEMVGRGDISGSSFAFRAKDEEWNKEGDIWVRTVKSFSALRDVTITTDPAYTETEVSVRSLEERDLALNPKEDTAYLNEIEQLRNLI